MSTESAIAEIKAKIAAGGKVTAAQVAAARSKDDLDALSAEVEAEAERQQQIERFTRARERLAKARADFQVTREAASERARIRITQALTELDDELTMGASEIGAAIREHRSIAGILGRDQGAGIPPRPRELVGELLREEIVPFWH